MLKKKKPPMSQRAVRIVRLECERQLAAKCDELGAEIGRRLLAEERVAVLENAIREARTSLFIMGETGAVYEELGKGLRAAPTNSEKL